MPVQLPVQNQLLAGLPPADRRRLLLRQAPVHLERGRTLIERGARIRHVYFPIDSFISLIVPLDRRSQLEVGLVGEDGMLGVSAMLGVNVSPLRAIVQGAGTAWRVDRQTFCAEVQRSTPLRLAVNRCIFLLLGQFAQTAACTRYHVVEARLARWLLMTRDHAHSSQFHITHEFLAYMLGVRRVGVTRAASALQARKLIRYHRGELQILNEKGLEAAACVCYATVKAQSARVRA